MRHAILVVGSNADRALPAPVIRLRHDEECRETIWFATTAKDGSTTLLDDSQSCLLRTLKTPRLAYRFYLIVQGTKLWSGKRPLVLIRGRSLSSRVAAYAGKWGGGDVVMVGSTDQKPLGPTRFVLDQNGDLQRCD